MKRRAGQEVRNWALGSNALNPSSDESCFLGKLPDPPGFPSLMGFGSFLFLFYFLFSFSVFLGWTGTSIVLDRILLGPPKPVLFLFRMTRQNFLEL